MNATRSIRNWPGKPVRPCGGIASIKPSRRCFWKPSSLPIWKWRSRRSIRWKRVPSRWISSGTERRERAQYEADLARRRYKAVDPDNRLVARSLEREWNEKLAEVERVEREYALL